MKDGAVLDVFVNDGSYSSKFQAGAFLLGACIGGYERHVPVALKVAKGDYERAAMDAFDRARYPFALHLFVTAVQFGLALDIDTLAAKHGRMHEPLGVGPADLHGIQRLVEDGQHRIALWYFLKFLLEDVKAS